MINDGTETLPGEGFKRPWPPLIKMDEETPEKINALFAQSTPPRSAARLPKPRPCSTIGR